MVSETGCGTGDFVSASQQARRPDLVAGGVDDEAVRARAGPPGSPTRRPPRPRRTAAARWPRAPAPGRRPSGSGSSNPPRAKVSPGRVQPAAARDPLGVDLQADHLDVGAHPAQPLEQLHGRHRRGAVAEVDDERISGRPQPGGLDAREPAVDPAQPVGVGGPAGDRTRSAGSARALPVARQHRLSVRRGRRGGWPGEPACAERWPAPPRGDAQRAHLAAGPARHRRRRRHERLRRRAGPPAGRTAASRSRSSPGPPAATCRRPSSSPRASLVRHVTAGPFEGLGKEDLPGQLCAFTRGVMRAEAGAEPG